MSRASVVVVGDALLDRDLVGTSARLCPDAPAPVIDDPAERIRPGGAALAAVLAACDGRPVTFVTALGDDSAGHLLAASLADAGVSVLDLGLDGPTPEKVRIRSGAQTLARLDRGSAPAEVRSPLTNEVRAVLAEAACVLVSDYGRGLAAKHDLRDVLARRNRRPVVWDPHPRGAQPVNGVLLATPNEAEAALFSPAISGSGLVATSARARDLARRWSARGVCVTRGAAGAVLSTGAGHPLVLAPPAVDRGDACGAGDRFAAAAACSLADGAVISEAVADAVAAARSFVADGGASSWEPPSNGDTPVRDGGGPDLSVDTVVAKTRARGGTVVATGGCFDLLHAGHVSFLTAARRLGDCLVVLMNSDRSVRRLKGPGRPIVAQGDRARVLAALASVDAVAVFDESTPVRALQRIRPDVFAKGGDYGGQDLPEGDALAAWGGEVVVLPYLEGRSTSRLVRTLEEVRTDG